MPLLFQDFMDWLEYNHPGIVLEHFQKELIRMSLTHIKAHIPKTSGRAMLKNVEEMFESKK